MLLINSEKGRELFSRARENMEVHKKDFNSIFAGNPMFTTSAIVPPKGHDFLVDLDNLAFSDAIKKYTHIPLFVKGLRKGKAILKRMILSEKK